MRHVVGVRKACVDTGFSLEDNGSWIMKKIEITLYKNFYPMKELRVFITEICNQLGCQSENAYHVKTALDEALTNIVRHARNDSKGTIKIRIQSTGEKVTVSLKDWGKPFAPGSVKRKSLDELVETKREGGLGLLTMERVMDKVTYRRKKNYNELTMVKYLKK